MAPKQTARPRAGSLLLESALLRSFPVKERVTDSADGGFGLQFDVAYVEM